METLLTKMAGRSRKKQRKNLHSLLKGNIKRESPFCTLGSSKKRISLMANLFRKAYRDDSFVVWRSSFLPTELLFAMDCVPFPPEIVISMFANSGIGTRMLNVAENNYHIRDTCSFLRGTYGAVIEDCLPAPDCLACTSLYCDGSAKLFYNLSREYNKEYFFIDVPYYYDRPYAVDYVANQLAKMTKQIGRVAGKPVDPNKISQAIKFSNEARNYFVKINELRQAVPSPIFGGEAINYAVMLAHTWGAPEIVDVYKALYEELKYRVDNRIGAVKGGELYRILWRNLKPYYSDYLMHYLELECKAVIAFEEVNFIHWDELDPNDPYRSLAKKMLSNPPLGEFERWLNLTIKEGVEKYKIDGVIEFAHWGCRHLNSGTQLLRNTLDNLDIPLLILDGDCIDLRDYADGQVKTRIDAFIELLERRKKRK